MPRKSTASPRCRSRPPRACSRAGCWRSSGGGGRWQTDGIASRRFDGYFSRMSFTELKEKVAQLTPAELAELRQVIETAETRPAVQRATPEMLAERRRLMDQVLT